MLAYALVFSAAAQIPAVHGAIQLAPPGEVVEGSLPVLGLQVPDRDAVYYVKCTVGETVQDWTTDVIPAGDSATFELPAQAGQTTAECELVARFANGLSERRAETVTWTWKPVEKPPALDEDADAAPALTPEEEAALQPAPQPTDESAAE